jgi:threonine/homoserine/homoserine lactone efflux protein
MSLETLAAFAFAFFVFAASPGPDNLTILSKTISHGPQYGIAYGFGVVTSIFGFVIFSAIGLNAIAKHINEHLGVIQYVGAVYLIYSGIAMWRSKAFIEEHSPKGGMIGLFLAGFLLNLSNPKMPIFYLALLPTVLGVDNLSARNVFLLLLLIASIEVIVVGGHIVLAHRARFYLSEPRRLRVLNKGAGSLMIGAGVLVASR